MTGNIEPATAAPALRTSAERWNGDLRAAVLAALRGTPTPPCGDEYHNMINGVAQFVATALTSGPAGLPNAPWADDIAQFLVGALRLDPVTPYGRAVAGTALSDDDAQHDAAGTTEGHHAV